MDVRPTAGPDGLRARTSGHVLHHGRCPRGHGRKGPSGTMQVCADGDLTPRVACCFGKARHVSNLKSATTGVGCALRAHS
jgi:hypothetical protein